MQQLYYADVHRHLANNLKQIQQQHQFEHLTIYEKNIENEILHLGYEIKRKQTTFRIYLRYLKLEQQSLLPFTPVWTCEKIEDNHLTKRGYDSFLEALLSINKQTYPSDKKQSS
ncbi:DUF5634 family protein [Amphibacillus jilinensis]|uniref:DUF5634 family protein n=1 Tax=Amphibacillus jilinensis TaxID=1216008 RepID=UPI00031DAE9A|nr:DUF5634 family protein [Amphibacillus jilinensis]